MTDMKTTRESAATGQTDLQRLTANAVRALAMDAVQQANSGHPGLPLGMADVAALLWSRYLKFDPQQPDWPDRDRFVLSAGHGSMLLYALLHLSGFDLPLSELKNFRQWNSRTPGHPEYGHTPGVETTTGPLGQGVSNAVGMALAERWLAARFNKSDFSIVNHRTFVIASDGDLMEGVSHEACSLAGHLGLGKLIVLYDDNQISIDGPTSLSCSEDVLLRFESYGWQTARADGHDVQAVSAALDDALADEARPAIIACRTVIGHPSPNRAGAAKAHGEPLGEDEVRLTKAVLGWPQDKTFHISPEARTLLERAAATGAAHQAAWQALFARYDEAYPHLGNMFRRAIKGELPRGWDQNLPAFAGAQPMATRAASGKVLDAMLPNLPMLLGGSADLTGSNKTRAGGVEAVRADDFSGRYLHFGVREHGMGAILNGLALHGGVIPFGGTFLIFSDYMRPTIRLAAMMGLGVIYVFTHDSIGLGEDGPTHQPIEHLLALRAIPNLVTLRPADATETAAAWRVALERRRAPTALALTRQKLPVLLPESAAAVRNGAYVLAEQPDAKVILIATGSEVHIALAAQKMLAATGVAARVVSAPSWELFDAMPAAYRAEVLPPAIPARVAVEAARTLGWERYVGAQGEVIGLDRFGASAPYETIYRELGLTAEAVAAAARRALRREQASP